MSGTSAAIRSMASSAAGVRSVSSITGSPPSTSARAIGTASAASCTTTTGMTGTMSSNDVGSLMMALLKTVAPSSAGPTAARMLANKFTSGADPFVGSAVPGRSGCGWRTPRRRCARSGFRRRRRGEMTSPSATRASGPPAAASGVRWIAAGTFPDAPDIRPSVTSATLCPRSCSTPRAGVSLCSSGMPRPLRALVAHDRDEIAVQRTGLEGVKKLLLAVEHDRGRGHDAVFGRSTADVLITLAPRFPVSVFSPPSGANGSSAVRTTVVSRLFACTVNPAQPLAGQLRGSVV